MRRRVEANIPPAQARAGAQARPRRPAGRRVRRPAAADGARPGRPVAAGRRHAAGAAWRCRPAATSAATDAATLIASYRFLRTVEHRLQLLRLRRTHLLPTDEQQLRWLARSLGYKPDHARRARSTSCDAELSLHTREVRRLHEKLFYRPLLSAVARVPGEHLQLGSKAAGDWLRGARVRRPRGGAAPPRRAHRRGLALGRRCRSTCCPCCCRPSPPAPTPTPACWPTGRSARRSAATSGSCACCATRVRSPSGWPSCSAPASTSPRC